MMLQTTDKKELLTDKGWLDIQDRLQSMELEAANNYLIATLSLGKLYTEYRFQHIDLEDTAQDINSNLISYRATAEFFGVSKDKVAQYVKAYDKRELIKKYYDKDIHTSIKKVVGIVDVIASQVKTKGIAEDKEGYTPKDKYLQSLRTEQLVMHNRKTQEDYIVDVDIVNRPAPLRDKIRHIDLEILDFTTTIQPKEYIEGKLERDLKILTTKRVSAKEQKMYKEQTSDEAYTDYSKTLEEFTSDEYTTKDIKSFLGAVNKTKLNKGAKGMMKLMETLLMQKIKLDKICDLEFMLEEYHK